MRRLTQTPRPHVPKIVPASVLRAVQPVLPAHFLASHVCKENVEAGFLGLFTIRADGTADVEIVESSGSDALDTLALQAARQYHFRPATLDGTPVDSHLRLRITFEVQ